MAEPTRRLSPAQKEHRLTVISDLWLRSQTPQQIADHLGITRNEVFRAMRQLETEWNSQRLLNQTAIRNRELHRLAHLERRTWDSFDKSEKALEHTRSRQRELRKRQTVADADKQPPDAQPSVIRLEGGDGVETLHTETEAVVRHEERIADPRFLLVLTRIQQMRIELLGLNQQADDERDKEREPIGVIEVYLDDGGKPRGQLYTPQEQSSGYVDADPEPAADGTVVIDVDPAPKLPAPAQQPEA